MIEFTNNSVCDECGGDIGDNDKVYCSKCYSELFVLKEELLDEVEKLKGKVKKLKGEIKRLKGRGERKPRKDIKAPEFELVTEGYDPSELKKNS